MVSHFQNPVFDALFCEEEDRFLDDGFLLKDPDSDEIPPQTPFDHDLIWDDAELSCLLSDEKLIPAGSIHDAISSDGSLRIARDESIRWMLRVIGHYRFTALTAVLAANYFDRFITNLCFQKDKPWMGQLAAVACLSVAAKVEETKVPLLIDLQVEECKYLFEAKTIQRMELLVLSTLKWKMNPVTPISYFDHFARRFGAMIQNLHWDFLSRCESVILSIITDCSLIHYHPSVIAAATMMLVIREREPVDFLDYQNRILDSLGVSKEKIDTCEKLIAASAAAEAEGDLVIRRSCHKRKHSSIPSSPSGVIDAYFGSDSSVDSWVVGSSVSSSPEPLMKRSRARVQHMRLGSMSSLSGWHG